MGETPKIYYNRNSKNKLSLLGSKAQEGVHSGVGCRQEPGEERDCLGLSEIRKKNSRGKEIKVQTQNCTGKCCLSSPKIKDQVVAVKKKKLLDIKSNKGFLLCKD